MFSNGFYPEMAIIDLTRAQLIYDAYHRSGGFDTGSYLVQHTREPPADYARRQLLATYDNLFKPGCQRYVGYLSRKPVERMTEQPLLQAILGDADRNKTSMASYMLDVAQDFKPFGNGIIVVDMPQENMPADQRAQIDQRMLPYFTAFDLSVIKDFSIDSTGHLTSLKIEQREYVDKKITTVERYWDDERWWVKVAGQILEQGDIGFGLCPAIEFSESQFPLEGEFSGVADLQKRIYNLTSKDDLVINDQSFSVFCYQVPPDLSAQFSDTEIALSIGTKNMVKYYGDQAPSYAAPDSGPSETIKDRITEAKNRINEITYKITQSGIPESGYAKLLNFQELNSSLSKYAERMEQFERRLWRVVCAMLRLPEESITINWPRDYSISDLDTEFDVLMNMQTNGFPPEAILAKKRQIVSLALPSLGDDESAAIDAGFLVEEQGQ